MDDTLRGRDGTIIGRSSGVIGSIGANEFDVKPAINGDDIYLTIDQNVQKYIESILPFYHEQFASDAISVIVMDPFTGAIKATANYPTYNPNNINSAVRYLPLDPTQAYIADREDYIDVHLFIQQDDGTMRKATTEERSDPTIRKRIAENTYGSEVFVDKTIKYAYEPGSVFKPITTAIGIDSDEISLYDFYHDDGEVKIDIGNGIEFTIRNVSSSCLGDKTYLNALTFSCNVGMISIIQKIGRPIFYNYLEKIGFGHKTNVELAGEEE
ncbi:MAG: hypothetical protein H6766_02290 [Candidatus Peribacteria bacterium]|nr:MAG: hypothetical protein H6766_02290 [Candidatus Peribacteria bacterium]